ncbi:methyltransferase, FkbM family [Nitrosomonas marina]|uniref:Methyltransferase, FkbM family n=1 Tax=Nitrosomonas marina TaxID=917 RepID=A0A1I0DX64_9PROT|nr:FkbM family methyltransferase [Nitrosomonas marina]SET37289.1 methyltransferase, FkbM family [Nitrosomonas marina]
MKSTISSPPWYFRLGKWMIRNHIRGGYRLLNTAGNLGLLNKTAEYRLNERITINVPLNRSGTWWDGEDVLQYDAPTVRLLASTIDTLADPAVFVDCGADIGMMSLLTAIHTDNIERFIAIEPNKKAFDILTENYRRLPVASEAKFGAIGRIKGTGKLNSPDYLPDDDHARFISESKDGDIPIYTIDDLGIAPQKSVVLKLDVEGSELDAILGATNTLANARQFVVDLEAHPLVAKRTHIDPIEILRQLNDIKPCQFTICEKPEITLQLDKDFFSQVETVNYDIIAVSK